jgi:RNA polymerase I-specific transcription initiation factor RRN7
VLERFFPLPERETVLPKAASGDERVELRATRLRDREEEVLRPGERYTLGDGGEMPEQYAAIVSRAAGWVGVREEYVRRVVESYERRMWQTWLRIRRDEL